MFAIMARDLKDYSYYTAMLSDAEKVYDNHKERNLSPESFAYGCVLVKMKRIKSGLEFKIRITRSLWLWKPEFETKTTGYFHWLCFMTWINFDYSEVPDKIIKDHLGEAKAHYEKDSTFEPKR